MYARTANRPNPATLPALLAASALATIHLLGCSSGPQSQSRTPPPPPEPAPAPAPPPAAPVVVTPPVETDGQLLRRVTPSLAADLRRAPAIARGPHPVPLAIVGPQTTDPGPAAARGEELQARVAEALLADAELAAMIRLLTSPSADADSALRAAGNAPVAPDGRRLPGTDTAPALPGRESALLLRIEVTREGPDSPPALAMRLERPATAEILLAKTYR